MSVVVILGLYSFASLVSILFVRPCERREGRRVEVVDFGGIPSLSTAVPVGGTCRVLPILVLSQYDVNVKVHAFLFAHSMWFAILFLFRAPCFQ